MVRWLVVSLGGVLLATTGLLVVGGAPVFSVATYPSGLEPPDEATASALAAIPADMLRLYGAAASACEGLAWQVLAAIGTVESANGTSVAPGVRSGSNAAGAEGPMQFLPATFEEFARPVPPGGADPPSPYDHADSVYAAARLLCSAGVGRPGELGRAIWTYNHSAAYVAKVLATARSYGLGETPLDAPDAPSRIGRIAVDFALAQVGTPYRWGGETVGVGFDCSGLVQAAYAAAGVHLPRVAAAQMAGGPRVAAGRSLAIGDLVFFGPPGGAATHVGLVVDPAGVMVDAPHTGASVRIESFPVAEGAHWGEDTYLGATRPASPPAVASGT